MILTDILLMAILAILLEDYVAKIRGKYKWRAVVNTLLAFGFLLFASHYGWWGGL